ncbi:hypothetical protein LV716_14175 [Flagellimonas sp. HMM57]|uniref:DUF6786 family protein n=1 Tax=unclassified Flagellimonas TaxID=2644544 RepID=UPI0013D8D519|nr:MULTISPECIES: DUF6786 family protein [unclassified Flagellimonas]UII75395.1 hypothetical protein LV716_14175 [Flagellimonas sp. HMM57]
MKKTPIILVFLIAIALSCKDNKENKKQKMPTTIDQQGSFAYDENFLKKWDENLVILESDENVVLVSGKYQAKVFTSTTSGREGRSLGWINYEAFGKTDMHMNAYGGENRFWLGPEGNAFSLFFKPNDEMVFDNWKTPAPIDSEPWKTVEKTNTYVTMESNMDLKNYSAHKFKIKAKRKVTLLTLNQIEELLQIQTSDLKIVGYNTENMITNVGSEAWTKKTGAPCIWILDMFPPSDNTNIVIPYKTDAIGEVATTDYFGEIPDNRVTYGDGVLFFKADGKSRGKLGISPQRATNVAGSYDAVNQILTITLFEVDADAAYLNQEWNLDADPFKGDAINAYNDGPLEDGSQMGPFYEIESVSPAAFLKPQESLMHNHAVFHFVGKTEQLESVAKSVFGVTLKEITNAL